MNEKLIAGTYIVKFNGNSFASGVYYYSLTTKDFKQTKKMMLIKQCVECVECVECIECVECVELIDSAGKDEFVFKSYKSSG